MSGCLSWCKKADYNFGRSRILETVLGTGWTALLVFTDELWGNSCLRARWWSGTQKVGEVRWEQSSSLHSIKVRLLTWASKIKVLLSILLVVHLVCNVTVPPFQCCHGSSFHTMGYFLCKPSVWCLKCCFSTNKRDTGVWLGRWGPWRQKDACTNRKLFPAVEGWVIQATSLLCAGTGRCLSPAVLAGSWAAVKCCAAHFGTCTLL